MLPHSGAAPEASASGEGLRDEPDSWQVSSLPEEKTYFGMDVSLRLVNVESLLDHNPLSRSPKDKVLDAAVTAIKARLGERDGNIRSAWLLTE